MDEFLGDIFNGSIVPIVALIALVVLIVLLILVARRPKPLLSHSSPDWCPGKEGETLDMLKGELRIFVEEVRDTGTEGRRSVIILVDSPGAAQGRFDIPEAGKIQYLSTEGHYYEVTVAEVDAKGAKFRAEQFTGHAKDDSQNKHDPAMAPREPELATNVKMETGTRTDDGNKDTR